MNCARVDLNVLVRCVQAYLRLARQLQEQLVGSTASRLVRAPHDHDAAVAVSAQSAAVSGAAASRAAAIAAAEAEATAARAAVLAAHRAPRTGSGAEHVWDRLMREPARRARHRAKPALPPVGARARQQRVRQRRSSFFKIKNNAKGYSEMGR